MVRKWPGCTCRTVCVRRLVCFFWGACVCVKEAVKCSLGTRVDEMRGNCSLRFKNDWIWKGLLRFHCWAGLRHTFLACCQCSWGGSAGGLDQMHTGHCSCGGAEHAHPQLLEEDTTEEVLLLRVCGRAATAVARLPGVTTSALLMRLTCSCAPGSVPSLLTCTHHLGSFSGFRIKISLPVSSSRGSPPWSSQRPSIKIFTHTL